jgi:MerR family transcriptional regulator, light-induced transcriptional regulator
LSDARHRATLALSIAAVERETGLSKDTLRVWERRYGFPVPLRDALGERAYPADQVEKLRVVKRLLDAGHRPGRVVTMPVHDLHVMADAASAPPDRPASAAQAAVQSFVDLIRRHDVAALRRELGQSLSRFGATRFVIDVISPLNVAVGDAWLRGQMEVFEEHLYTEAVQVVLRQAIAHMPDTAPGGRPRVLLGTLPGEPHGLGLLMAETLMTLEGCACVSLGVQTPVWDLARAARAQQSDIVALGFTGCMNPNQVVLGLQELRAQVPAETAVWAGGAAPVLVRRRVDGVDPVASMDAMLELLRAWRARVMPPSTPALL